MQAASAKLPVLLVTILIKWKLINGSVNKEAAGKLAVSQLHRAGHLWVWWGDHWWRHLPRQRWPSFISHIPAARGRSAGRLGSSADAMAAPRARKLPKGSTTPFSVRTQNENRNKKTLSGRCCKSVALYLLNEVAGRCMRRLGRVLVATCKCPDVCESKTDK